MAFWATLLVLAATVQCHSAPGVQATGPAQPDATRLPAGTATQEPAAGRLPGKDNAAMPLAGDADAGDTSGLEDASPCLDAELQKRGLDKYGNAPGTMYAGGTPLFDEATGKRKDRTAYVYAHHPEIAQACAASDGGR